jgi:hypothetical protein
MERASQTALNRRSFLQAGLLSGAALALPGVRAAAASGTPAPAGPVSPRRTRLARHRHLFNGDCNFLFYNPELWQPEGGRYGVPAIERYLAAIAAGGIDTLLINPNTQVAWYPSRRLPHILQGYTRGDLDHARTIGAGLAGMTPTLAETYASTLVATLDLYLDLAEAGVDWLAESARIARARGMSPWLSYRMNPTHFSSAPDSPVNAPVFRDPRNRLSGRTPDAAGSIHAAWIGLNYGRAEVRDYMAAMIQEGVQGYDYEGLELDWLRHPVCLETPASQAHIDTITDWIAGLRALTRARHPDYRLTIRAPANLGYLRQTGLDLAELARRDLVDGFTFSNFWQTPWELPIDELRRELGPDVAIYGGMEDAPNWLETVAPALTERPAGPDVQLAGDNAYRGKTPAGAAERVRGTRYLTASPEFLRASAAGKLVLGADGLEQFNFFVTDQVRVPGLRADYGALRGLDQLAQLRGQPKHYAFNTVSLQGTKLWDVPEQLPVRIAPRHRRALRLPMCAEPAAAGLRLVIQVVVEQSAPAAGWGVSLNGAWPLFAGEDTPLLLFPAGPYTRHVDEHRARNFSLDAGGLRDGWNEITIYNDAATELPVVVVEIGLLRDA